MLMFSSFPPARKGEGEGLSAYPMTRLSLKNGARSRGYQRSSSKKGSEPIWYPSPVCTQAHDFFVSFVKNKKMAGHRNHGSSDPMESDVRPFGGVSS